MCAIAPNYAEFSDLKLANIYNAVNQHYPYEKYFYSDFASVKSKSKRLFVLARA